MFVLVNYNKNNYDHLCTEILKYNYTPIPLFKLILTNKKEDNKSNLFKLKSILNSNNFKFSAIQVTLLNIDNSTQSFINSLKQDFNLVIGLGGLNKVNRFFLEQTQIDFLQDPHNSIFKTKFDFIHHFNSGLNQVLCKFAREREIGIINSLNFFNKNEIIILKDIGRISQNTQFARKYNLPIYSNFIIENSSQIKSILELSSILRQFKMDENQIKLSQEILEQKIQTNLFKKSSNYITSGITKL